MSATTALGVHVGTVVAGGAVAEAVIFSDVSYLYLAIVGALVSMFGVAHEIYGKNHKIYGLGEKVMEMIKGLALGVLAIPFWFISITSLGSIMMVKYFGAAPEEDVFSSLALIVAFGLSWFTVPIFDFVAKTIPDLAKSIVSRFKSKGV